MNINTRKYTWTIELLWHSNLFLHKHKNIQMFANQYISFQQSVYVKMNELDILTNFHTVLSYQILKFISEIKFILLSLVKTHCKWVKQPYFQLQPSPWKWDRGLRKLQWEWNRFSPEQQSDLPQITKQSRNIHKKLYT